MDSDMHVQEPADLWQRYTDPAFRDRAPRGLTEGIADLRLVGPDGEPWGRRTPSRSRSGPNYRRYQEKYRPYEERGWTGRVQLDAMDEEGIDIAVLYPSRGLYALATPGMEPALAAAVARAYNDWLYDFSRADPRRLLGAGMISPFAVEDAVAEARRCVEKLGFKAVFLRPNVIDGRNWHDPYYDPLWSTLEELGVPLGFHEGANPKLGQVGDQFGENSLLRHIVCHPFEQMLALTSFCAGGALERHPRLKVAFLEGNSSWAPFLLWRMDEHWEWMGDAYATELTMAPSTYFNRQCFLSVECDELPVRSVIAEVGDGRLVFSTDFPHADAKFPRATASFLAMPLPEDSKRRILWDNCAAYYGIEG
jgi:predicted TIM-barrel fold metal-dependent hydrolase